MLPDYVTQEAVADAKQKVIEKKGVGIADEAELFIMTEGKCVQMLHVGSFSDEPESIKRIMEFSDTHKLTKNGHHHEIYLSDFRKTEEAKLKTILREPVN